MNAQLEQWSRPQIILSSFLLTLLLGVIDYLTGYEWSFSLFYVLPVSLATWYAGRSAGLFISILDAGAWSISNYLAGQAYSHPLILYWNTAIRFGFYILVTFLLTRIRQALQIEYELARLDGLTGLLNGRAFRESAAREIERTRRNHKSFSVAYIDLDNFKFVNDTYGHSRGDELLRSVADAMRTGVRSSDLVARLGGDEFALLLPETDLQQAERTMFRLRSQLQQIAKAHNLPISFSAGVLVYLQPPESYDPMVKLADNLMYEVKAAGKNAVRFRVYPTENENVSLGH